MKIQNFNDYRLNENSGSIYVMVFKGKNDSVDAVTLHTFTSKELANDFVKKTTDNAKKYWTFAQIVSEGEEIDIYAGDMQDQDF